MKPVSLFFSFCFLLLVTLTVKAENPASLSLSSGNEISYTKYPAGDKQKPLLLWFYSEAGTQPSDSKIASQLASLGLETWTVDLFDSYFLPVSLSSIDQIPAADISEFIQLAARQTGKKIIPVTTGRSGILLLKAARQLQLNNPSFTFLTGLVLLSPKFYVETPDPGTEARLMPVVTHSNQLVFVMQPVKSPWYWKLDNTIPALEKNGSDVFIQRVANVRDRFYFRPDADDYEKKISLQLPGFLRRAVSALENFPAKQRKAVKISVPAMPVKPASKKDRKLGLHKGNPLPEALRLPSLDHTVVDLKQHHGKVVLVNFWATWCPPCVHEMPSMQRLQEQFSNKKFTILGINMAEDEQIIQQFLKNRISITFPILLDRNGDALKRWQVFAFPTSYVIDKKGHIRYSLFGSIEWDRPETIKVFQDLLDEDL